MEAISSLPNATRTSRLVNSLPNFDAPNDLEEFKRRDKLLHHFNILKEKLEGKSESEVSAFLASAAKTPGFNEVASDGFIYGILTDIPNARKHFANLYQYGAAVGDGWYQALLKMNMILLEIFFKLRSESRQQIIFFFAEAIHNNIPKIDNVLTNLLRTVSEGADYKETCTVIHGISEVLINNKEWMRGLKTGGTFAPVTLLTLSRFISDQHANSVDSGGFRHAVAVCDFLLKERFQDLLLLGRDLVLVLMRLSKISPFNNYWRTLLKNPTSLSPKCSGVGQLMSTHCANILLSYRVSLHIQRKIDFLLKMRSLAQTKYLDWFHRTHLSSADSGSLRADIIRTIWFNVHLPELQQSVIIEVRAQLLAWLLKNAKGGADMPWCKLMLFWDWFGFDPQVANSIQLVEPAFSLIRYLISTGSPLANTLLDYLLRTCTSLHPPLAADFIASVTAAFKALASAGMPVVSVLESPRLDKPVRDALHETFPEVFPKRSGGSAAGGPPTHGACISGPGTSTAGLVNDLQEPGSIIDFDAIRSSSGSTHSADGSSVDYGSSAHEKKSSHRSDNNHHHGHRHHEKHHLDRHSGTAGLPRDPAKHHKKKLAKKKQSLASDDETDSAPSVSSTPIVEAANPIPLPEIYEYERNDKPLWIFLPMVKQEFREHLEALSAGLGQAEDIDRKENDSANEAMQNLMTAISDEDDGLDDEQAELIAECLLRIFHRYLKKRKFMPTEDFGDESLSEFFDRNPLFALFRQISMGGSDCDNSRRQLLVVLSEMRERCGAIGYLFIYFICGAKRDTDTEAVAISAYEEFCRFLNKSVETQTLEDMQQCALHDHELFGYLLLYVLHRLPSSGQPPAVEMVHLMCAHIDAKQLSDFIGEIVRENVVIFYKSTFSQLLASSLNWETVEQMLLWHLIRAEGVPLEWMLSVIPRINYAKHYEAATNVLLTLRSSENVTMALLRNMFSRSANDLFTVHALKILLNVEENVNKIAQMLNTLVKKLIVSNDIMNPSSSSSSSSKSAAKSGSERLAKKSGTLTVYNVFAQLDSFRKSCLTKDSRRGEAFLSNSHLQEMFTFSKCESKLEELNASFSELFAVMEIFSDEVNTMRSHRKNRPRSTDFETNHNSDVKAKRRRVREDSSDDDD